MKIKKMFKVFITSIVFSAVLTSCNLFSSSPNMREYVVETKSPHLSGFTELKLENYGFSPSAYLLSGYESDTYIVKDGQKYGLINLKTRKATSAIYESAYESSTYMGLFYVSKTIDDDIYYGVANTDGETDFSAFYTSSISVTNEGYITTPNSFYRVENSKITLIANKNNQDSLALTMSGTKIFVDEYIINVTTNYTTNIVVFKNRSYQHTFILNDFSAYYIGDGKFIIQKSDYISDDLHNVTDYDYVSSSGYAYKLTTKIYDAKANKVKKCSINEPIQSVSKMSSFAGRDFPSYMTAPKKESYVLSTNKIVNRVLSNTANIRVVNSNLNVLVNVSEGEKLMNLISDDLTIYTDITGILFIKNKKNEMIYVGSDISNYLHNNVVFGKHFNSETRYGAITANGVSIGATYDELHAGPNALFGKTGEDYFRIDFAGNRTKLFDILELCEVFYVKDLGDLNEIISYGNPNAKLSFKKEYTHSYEMNYETVLVSLDAGTGVPRYFVGDLTV